MYRTKHRKGPMHRLAPRRIIWAFKVKPKLIWAPINQSNTQLFMGKSMVYQFMCQSMFRIRFVGFPGPEPGPKKLPNVTILLNRLTHLLWNHRFASTCLFLLYFCYVVVSYSYLCIAPCSSEPRHQCVFQLFLTLGIQGFGNMQQPQAKRIGHG